MGEESEQLRREIDRTRQSLGADVDALTEKVSPKRVVERRVDRTKDAIGGLKEKVMGTTASTGQGLSSAASGAAGSVQDAASGAVGSVQDAASSVGDTATSTARAARRQAQGNPLAAGVIAFGLGWLVSSLLPASQKEQEVAQQVKEQAQPAVGEVLSDVKDNLRQPAQEAVQSVKDTATDAVGTVQDEARSAASDVKDQARSSTQEVRQQAPTS